MGSVQGFTEQDKKYMKIALKQAEKGRGHTRPNPMVGAAIVKNNKVISLGYHHKAGSPHAEIEAINNSPVPVRDSTMYVTLEPCTVHGRTPPCVDALIKSRISEVIIGAKDPNPAVSGKGITALRNAGIKVRTGLYAGEIAAQNEIFFKHITAGVPFVCAKIASTLDGKLATRTMDSKWITSLESRAEVQKLRAEYGCVLTGVGTILNDDPLLFPKKNPESRSGYFKGNFLGDDPEGFFRIILDSSLRTPLESKLAKTSGWCRTIIFCSKDNSGKIGNKVEKLRNRGIDLVFTGENKRGMLDLDKILKRIYHDHEIVSIVLESGPQLLTSFLKADLIDKFIIFTAPRILGGGGSLEMFGDLGIKKMKDSIGLEITDIKKTGRDMMITAYPSGKSRPAYDY
jgi:diaminohydroxyphosphoribosylaminopyrimidine deaminase/5-amino-6-(5-phosphoribosylamino)uracil reductase